MGCGAKVGEEVAACDGEAAPFDRENSENEGTMLLEVDLGGAAADEATGVEVDEVAAFPTTPPGDGEEEEFPYFRSISSKKS